MTEKKLYKRHENEIAECQTTWVRMMPHFQAICDKAKELGLTPSAELMYDLFERRGRGCIGLLANMTEENAKRIGVTDPAVIETMKGNPAARIVPMIQSVEMVEHCQRTTFLPNMKAGSLVYSHLSFDEAGNPVLTDTEFVKITDEYFSVWADSKPAQTILKAAEQVIPALNEIFQAVWAIDPTAQFHEIFSYNRDLKTLELRARVLEVVDLQSKK